METNRGVDGYESGPLAPGRVGFEPQQRGREKARPREEGASHDKAPRMKGPNVETFGEVTSSPFCLRSGYNIFSRQPFTPLAHFSAAAEA
jgi:hypothetical protein